LKEPDGRFALRNQQIGVSAVNNRGIHAVPSNYMFPIDASLPGTMLHDRDFATFIGKHSTNEIRIQLRCGSGHLGRDDTHLSRLLCLLDDCEGESLRRFSRSASAPAAPKGLVKLNHAQ
jgi:hypothetical protein